MSDAAGIPVLSGGWTEHLREFKRDPFGIQERFNRECGALGQFRFFGFKEVIVNSPELVEELLVAKAKSFRKSSVLRLGLQPLLGDGLFTSEGELWKRQRKLMAPLFQPGQMGRYAATMSDLARRRAEGWSEGATVDVGREMTAVTMAIAGRTLFDADIDGDSDQLGAALTTSLAWVAEATQSVGIIFQSVLVDRLGISDKSWLGRPIRWPGKRARALGEALAVLEERVGRMIAERRGAATSRDDLLARLLASTDGTGGQGMSDQQLRDEIITLFVAGHETTATALTWALYLLGRHPEVYARLEEEVATLDGSRLTAADLPRLPLATRVFKEALRLYPPVPILERQAIEPVEIGGHRLAAGQYVAALPWALHHRPELWPEPDRFDPDRFTPEAEAARARYAYVPFGAGPRVCIGNQFALMEGPLVLATMLGHARLDPIDGPAIGPDPATPTLRPRQAIQMRVRLRRPATAIHPARSERA